MSTEYKNSPFSFKVALWIGYIGFALAAISAILMTEESLCEKANVYFLIGVGTIVVSGLIHAARFAHEAWTGLKNSWSRS